MTTAEHAVAAALRTYGKRVLRWWALPFTGRRAWTVYKMKPGTNCPVPLGSFGITFNKHSTWVGAHYSAYNKRLCVNLIPCCTVWFTQPGGRMP